MDVKQRMESKWDEITATTKEREALFSDFDKHKDRIADLHFDIEIKKLQYLFMKRDQLNDLKQTAIDPEGVNRVEKINETCIRLSQKHLVEKGFEERLKLETLI